MNKKIIIPAVLVLAALAVWFAAGKADSGKAVEEKNTGAAEIAVKTAMAAGGTIKPSLAISGSVSGGREIVLTAKTQGIITALTARTGERVSAGQTVVALESDNQRLAVEKSLEQVKAAKLVLDKAEKDFGRIEALYKQGAVSDTELETAGYALDSARVAYNVARSDNLLANQSVEDTSVTAPFSGSVVECFVEQGETVFPGGKLMTVVDDASLVIRAGLTADQQKLARVGQQGVFTTTVHTGKEFACRVKSISSQADSSSRTYEAEFTLEGDAAKLLKPGMFGHVILRTEGISGLLIPREALVTRDESGMAEVFTVRDGKSYKSRIKTGDSDDNSIVVLEGLKEGDRVVTFGQSRLKDGEVVKEGE